MSRYPQSLRRALRRLALDDNVVPAAGVYRRPAVRPAAYYMPFGVQFAWDVPYSAYALARLGGDAELCRGFVENMLDVAVTHGPDKGMVQRSVTADGGRAGQDGSQCPLLAWTTLELHRLHPDDDFVRRVYPALAASLDWWQSPRRDVDGDGLSEYAGSTPTFVAYESGHDYSPERDLVLGEPTGPGPDELVHEPIADVFLNACIYAELDALAELARTADPARVDEWARRRDALRRRMTEAMWDDTIGGFWPVVRRDLCAAQPRVYRHTPALLQPLWAGLATDDQAARTVDVLLGHPLGYAMFDGTMEIRLDPGLYHRYQVVSDRGLHPTRGRGGAAGGVELTADGLVARFGDDRGPAAEPYTRLQVEVDVVGGTGRVAVHVVDGSGAKHVALDEAVAGAGTYGAQLGRDPLLEIDGRTWLPGLREVRLRAGGCQVGAVRVRHARMSRTGLLSRYGLKSAHPLDGKHPAPGVPTEFWSGTVWGPHQLHACQALRRYGYDELARAVARAFCDGVATAYAAGGDAFEHHGADDGQGLGVPGYTWGGGLALVLMTDYIDDEES